MHVLALTCRPEETDRLVAELWERGTAGVIEEEGGLRAFFPEGTEMSALATAFSAYAPCWEHAPERDWVALAQSLWEPLPVGARFFLVPEWRGDPTPPGRLRLAIRPGQACGTGWYAATRLCLEAMERRLTRGCAVLDIGAGSGILAMAAALDGAGRVIACDIDWQAVREARERCGAALFCGSVRSVRSRSVDLAVANINAHTIVQLAGEIARVLRPGGVAIVSGFRQKHAPLVRAALERSGRAIEEILEEDEWLAFVC